MRDLEDPMPANRFSVVDLIVDLFLLASSISIPVEIHLELLAPKSAAFASQLLHLGLLFLIYFGIALYVSQIFCAATIQSGVRYPLEVFETSLHLTSFTGIMIITFILSAALLFRVLTLPVVSGGLLIAQALFFGFSLGLDYGIQRHKTEDPGYDPPMSNIVSRSLSHIPYLVLTVAIVFPAEYLVMARPGPIQARIGAIACSIAVAIALAYGIDRLVFRRLRISERMSTATVAVVSVLMVVGFVGIDALEIIAQNQKEVAVSGIVRVILLFFVGVVPVRIGMLLFSRAGWFNRILGGIAVVTYVLVQSEAVELPKFL